jgi:hypothetical protein
MSSRGSKSRNGQDAIFRTSKLKRKKKMKEGE